MIFWLTYYLSNQQTNTQIYSISNDIKQRIAANSQIWEVGKNCLPFLLKNYPKMIVVSLSANHLTDKLFD